MTAKKIVAALEVVAALVFVLGAISAASAQSAYTSGTIASSEAAGYPAPYTYGNNLYAYAPGYSHGHANIGGRPQIATRRYSKSQS